MADYEFMDSLTAADFLLLDNGGEWKDCTQHLETMKRAAPTASVAYDDVRVRLFGSVALLHGRFEASVDDAPLRRVRYSNAYRWNGAHKAM